MAKQSKNKVKLEKQYRKIGVIPKSAVKKIKEHLDIPNDATSIRSNPENVLKHNKKHLSAIKQALDALGITKDGYAEYVAKNYNQIRLGNKSNSIVLKGGCQQHPPSRLPDLSVNHPTHNKARCEGFGKWTMQKYNKFHSPQHFY